MYLELFIYLCIVVIAPHLMDTSHDPCGVCTVSLLTFFHLLSLSYPLLLVPDVLNAEPNAALIPASGCAVLAGCAAKFAIRSASS